MQLMRWVPKILGRRRVVQSHPTKAFVQVAASLGKSLSDKKRPLTAKRGAASEATTPKIRVVRPLA